MTGMATHKRNSRHAGGDTAARHNPWPLALIAAPAAVAIWAGWVGLGGMCGFGLVQPLPGIFSWHLNTAITLPVGIESYGAYALYVWLGGHGSDRTRTWAKKSAIGALVLGCLGQLAFHLMVAAGWARAPWYVVMLVACLPVVTVYFAATLVHLIRADRVADEEPQELTGPGSDAAQPAPGAAIESQAEAALPPPVTAQPRDTESDTEPRRKPGTAARKKRAAAAPRTTVPKDVDTQAEALRILADNPDIDGSELGRQLGMTPGYGRTLKRRLITAAAPKGQDPEE